jgi:hypothetical protein
LQQRADGHRGYAATQKKPAIVWKIVDDLNAARVSSLENMFQYLG